MVRAVPAAIAAGTRDRKAAFQQMSGDTPPDPLARLGEKLDKAQRERLGADASRSSGPPPGAMGLGFRIAIELVAALCVGLALGWVFDRALGTRHHWGLIVFFLLGSAAGMLNVFRAAQGLGRKAAPPAGRRQDRPDRDQQRVEDEGGG